MSPLYFRELFHLKPHVNSMALNLISSLTDSFSSGIQAVIGTASFFFDINFYLMVIIAADFKIPVNTFSKLLSRKEKGKDRLRSWGSSELIEHSLRLIGCQTLVSFPGQTIRWLRCRNNLFNKHFEE